jgi:hypothetical protein
MDDRLLFTSQQGSSLLFRRMVGLCAGLILLSIVLGCMSFSFGGRTELVHDEDGAYTQSGTISIPGNHEQDVYYAVAYQSPPNLTLEDSWNTCAITGQWPDHFRVSNPRLFSCELTWKARGIKALDRTIMVPIPDAAKDSNPPPQFPASAGTPSATDRPMH